MSIYEARVDVLLLHIIHGRSLLSIEYFVLRANSHDFPIANSDSLIGVVVGI